MYLCQYISEDVNASYTADIAFWSMVIFFSCIKSRLKQLRERLHVASEIRIYTCGFNTGTGRLTKAILQFFNWPQTVLFNLFLFFFFFLKSDKMTSSRKCPHRWLMIEKLIVKPTIKVSHIDEIISSRKWNNSHKERNYNCHQLVKQSTPTSIFCVCSQTRRTIEGKVKSGTFIVSQWTSCEF